MYVSERTTLNNLHLNRVCYRIAITRIAVFELLTKNTIKSFEECKNKLIQKNKKKWYLSFSKVKVVHFPY